VKATALLGLLLAGGVAGAQERPGSSSAAPGTADTTGPPGATRTGALLVTYRSQTAVYVSAGRAAGLAIGDRLALMSGQDKMAELEVVFLAEHSSSCTVVSETRPVKPGDRLVRLGAPKPAPAADGPREITVSPGSERPTAYAPAARPGADQRQRVYGSVSGGYGTFQDRSGSARDIDERLVRADVVGRSLGGLPLDARVRASGRQIERANVRGFAVDATDSRHRLYEASVSWAPREARYSAAAGRLGAYPVRGLGFLDGVMGQVGVLSGLQVGAFAGRTPDALDVGVPSGTKYGAFLRLGGRGGSVPGDFTVSGVRESAGDVVSREYVAQQAQLRHGSLWLYESVEVDVNRGWRRERAGRGLDLSEARAQVRWRASPTADVTISYDRSRNYWTALTSAITSEIFDRRLRETLRADVSLMRPGGMGVWMGASSRTEEGVAERSYAAHAGVRSPRLVAVDLSLEGSLFHTPTARGGLGTVRAGRSLRGGHRFDLSYTANRYETFATGWRLSHWVRGSAYAQMRAGLFGRADLEYALADELPGVRGFLEIGYRF
jgi:hypothetical protein